MPLQIPHDFWHLSLNQEKSPWFVQAHKYLLQSSSYVSEHPGVSLKRLLYYDVKLRFFKTKKFISVAKRYIIIKYSIKIYSVPEHLPHAFLQLLNM